MNINHHYLKRYDKFITYYSKTFIPVDGYYEKHHIIPKCFADELNKDLINLPDNLVLLSARAHFIAHALLHKAYPNNKELSHAFAMMIVNNNHQNRKYSSKLYEMAKMARSKALKGVPRPEYVKEKLRKPKSNKENYKRPKTTEHKNNIAKGLKGKSKTKEHINKLVSSQKWYHEQRTKQMQDKKSKCQIEYLASGLTKKQFSEVYNIPMGTLKRYLKGL